MHCIACLKQGSCLHTLGMHACPCLPLSGACHAAFWPCDILALCQFGLVIFWPCDILALCQFGLATFWPCDMQAAWRGLLARRTAQERRKDIAAAKIAATWRMYQQRKAFVMHTRYTSSNSSCFWLGPLLKPSSMHHCSALHSVHEASWVLAS